jgi:hypothetical protein
MDANNLSSNDQRPKLRERESLRRLLIIRCAGFRNQSAKRAGDAIFGSWKGKTAQRVKHWRRSRKIPFSEANFGSAKRIFVQWKRKSLQRSENRLGQAEYRLNEANFGSWKKKSPCCAENRHQRSENRFNEAKIGSTERKSVQRSKKSVQRAEQRSTEEQISTGYGSAELPDGISTQSPSKDLSLKILSLKISEKASWRQGTDAGSPPKAVYQ